MTAALMCRLRVWRWAARRQCHGSVVCCQYVDQPTCNSSAGHREGDFARWVNGPITRYCGYDLHSRCGGTVQTFIFESACECVCHEPPHTAQERGA